MQLGMIGLGRMGANMVRRLLRGGHECVVFDPVPEAVESLVRERATGAASIKDMGKVMGALKSELAGRADMGAVSARIKQKLG